MWTLWLIQVPVLVKGKAVSKWKSSAVLRGIVESDTVGLGYKVTMESETQP